jgi:hypothetical protein
MYFKSNIFPYPPTFPLCSFNLFFQALLQLSVFIFKLEFSSTIVETISSKYLFRQWQKFPNSDDLSIWKWNNYGMHDCIQ